MCGFPCFELRDMKQVWVLCVKVSGMPAVIKVIIVITAIML
jgi:hypothetical protein